MKTYREIDEFYVNTKHPHIIGFYSQHLETLLKTIVPVEREDSGNWFWYIGTEQRSEENDYYMDSNKEVALLKEFENEMFNELIEVKKIESTNIVEVLNSNSFCKISNDEDRVFIFEPKTNIVYACNTVDFKKINLSIDGCYFLSIPKNININLLNDYIDSKYFESSINIFFHGVYSQYENNKIVKTFYDENSIKAINAISKKLQSLM